MKITCNHPNSSYGVPVILDDDGLPLSYPTGMNKALERIGWTREQAAKAAGYSVRTIERYWTDGVVPSARFLNVLAAELPFCGRPPDK